MEDCMISVTATNGQNTLAADAEMFSLNRREWDQRMALFQGHGNLVAQRMHKEGHQMVMKVLAPRETQDGDSPTLAAVGFAVDWRVAARLEMVEAANDIFSKAWLLGPVDGALSVVLAQVIEGKGLYEHSVGELFQLYGEFEGKHQVAYRDTETEMMSLVNGDARYLKDYREGGKWRQVPLPYAARNILAHVNNPNILDIQGGELKTSIELLRSWVK